MAENSKIASRPLKRLRWSELERVALDSGVDPAVIRRARTREELRRAIIAAELRTAA